MGKVDKFASIQKEAQKAGKKKAPAPAKAAKAEEVAQDEEEEYEEEYEAPVAEAPKAKKEEKKKEPKAKKQSDMEMMEEQEQEARKMRIKKRLMNMLMVGIFMDADAGESGAGPPDSGKIKKQKKPSAKDKSSGWEDFSIRQFIDKYSGPLMMFGLIVFLGVARFAEEGYSPSRSDSEENFYDVLGLARGEEMMAVRKAYKGLALTWHPDKNPDCEACAERFAKISKAYDTLSNNEKKQAYDSNKKGPEELVAANSIEITAENFEATVLRSNEVWIVLVFDPSEGMCHSFHPVWEDVSAKMNGVVRFGRIDVTKNKRATDFLPQRVVLMPMLYRFMRGRDPEPFMPVQGDRRSEDVDLARPFTRFVLGTYPEIVRHTEAEDLTKWWSAASSSRLRLLIVGATPGGRASQNEGLMKVQKIAHVWGELAEFAFTDHRTAEAALGKQFKPNSRVSHQLLVSPLSATATPKTIEVDSGDKLPAGLEEIIATASHELIPVLTLRNYQQQCGPRDSARSFCLVFVDGAASSSSEMVKMLAEVEASRKSYAQEMLDVQSGDDPEAVAEPINISPVRIMTGNSHFPWKPPAAGPHFSSMWAEAKYTASFVLELETRRVGAVKTKSLADIFQQVAYEDLKLFDLPETVAYSRTFADAEVTFKKELMAMVTTVFGAIVTFIFVAVGVAVFPELELPIIGVACASAFTLLLMISPAVCRRFLAIFVGTTTSFF